MANIKMVVEAAAGQSVNELLKVAEAQREIERETRKAAKASQQGSGEMGVFSDKIKGIGTALAGAFSVTSLISAGTNALDNWVKKMEQFSMEAKKASNEIVALAALQEGGTKAQRVQQAAALASRFGIQERGEAFNTVQALQSAPGSDFDTGLKASEAVFRATQIGIPLESGREAEIFGLGQGQAPGSFLRSAFIAGQASSRDPAVLAKAAPALQFFEDKNFGFASASVLAGSVRPDELQTFTKAAGIGLSSTSTLADTFKELGVLEGATPEQRLHALKGAGIETTDQLKEAGLSEIRQQQSIAALIRNLDQVGSIKSQIIDQNVPGLLTRQRAQVEAELPFTTTAREIDIIKSNISDARAFGSTGQAALDLTRSRAAEAQARVELGRENYGPIPLVNENDEAEVGFWASIGRAFDRSVNGDSGIRMGMGIGGMNVSNTGVASDPLLDRQNEILEELRKQSEILQSSLGEQQASNAATESSGVKTAVAVAERNEAIE